MNNNQNSTNKALQTQIVAQWITSLAISVVCCAVLFIVFAGYIVELHDTTNLLTVKLEVLQERHNQLNSEVTLIKRPTVVQINNAQPQQQQQQTAPDAAPVPPSPNAPNTPPAPANTPQGQGAPSSSAPVDMMSPTMPEIGGADPMNMSDVMPPEPKVDLMPVTNDKDMKNQPAKPAKPTAAPKKP